MKTKIEVRDKVFEKGSDGSLIYVVHSVSIFGDELLLRNGETGEMFRGRYCDYEVKDKEYTIEIKLGVRELANLYDLNKENGCIYNADLNKYECGVAALVSRVVRGGCEGYRSFVEDYEEVAGAHNSQD